MLRDTVAGSHASASQPPRSTARGDDNNNLVADADAEEDEEEEEDGGRGGRQQAGASGSGRSTIMVATDVAARGLDFPGTVRGVRVGEGGTEIVRKRWLCQRQRQEHYHGGY